MSLEWWISDDVSILCEEAACELDTVPQKGLLGGVRLPHELQWDKSPLLCGNEERSQNVIGLVISWGVRSDFLVAQIVKSLLAMWETQVGSLQWEMTTHSTILAWKIPWVEEPGGLQSIGPQRISYDWATSLQEFTKFRELWLVCGVIVKNNWLKTTVKISFFFSLYLGRRLFLLIGRRLSSQTGKTYFEKVARFWLPQSQCSNWPSYTPLLLESS